MALIICSDIARYPLGSAGEPTQGAGAVAFIVSERPRLVELEVARTGSYTRDVHDFWRPLDRKDALTDGHFSVQCYLDALEAALGAPLHEDLQVWFGAWWCIPFEAQLGGETFVLSLVGSPADWDRACENIARHAEASVSSASRRCSSEGIERAFSTAANAASWPGRGSKCQKPSVRR
mgnify:CR=1 FL=1